MHFPSFYRSFLERFRWKLKKQKQKKTAKIIVIDKFGFAENLEIICRLFNNFIHKKNS